MAVVMKQCKCESTFQDNEYGKGMRVHSEADKGDKCTVCGTRNSGGSVYKKKKK